MTKFFYATTSKVPLDGVGFQYNAKTGLTLRPELDFIPKSMDAGERFESFTTLGKLNIPTDTTMLVAYEVNQHGEIDETINFSYFIGNLYPDIWPDNVDEPGAYIVMADGAAYRVAPQNLSHVKIIPPEAVGLKAFPVWQGDPTYKGEVYRN